MKEPTLTRMQESVSSLKKDFIEWSDALSVGVEEVDQQHKGLAQMVNELNGAIHGGWGKETRDDIIVKLLEYTRVHFATEESLMSISNYPHLKEHKKQHENLIDIVKAYVKKYNENPEASNYEFLFFLKRWLVEHIMKDDKLMGEYLIKTGSVKTKKPTSWWGGLRKPFGH
ncbi:putative hemerythrin-like protein [Candidatus Competibacter denitrificans Run_A_D11]|uniref:Hemerythrin-like protein n=1 Tax=Candidatus Competibacter denitrificans Run_A_D11 TaxID=1400863 RepID=W6M7A8_9GAMM|nr:bacteriohemerythrin [Candidatus Competibacter denitrificans]CDI03826.1 putative hemerythrin-like protein [Candidatus Competibacter denitrificans Run_A_D11]HAS85225.1 hemerythrin [Candidatus Competibacteraceae bacterium]HRC68799.1 bacteriohemerythrin [Candidatus Competibacter denitrificans]